jgi:hypothetical protein
MKLRLVNFHEIPWNSMGNFMDFHFIKFHGISWSSMEFHEIWFRQGRSIQRDIRSDKPITSVFSVKSQNVTLALSLDVAY